MNSAKWDLEGYWITDTQDIIYINHDAGIHHADILFEHFDEYICQSEIEECEAGGRDYKEDGYIRDMLLQVAFELGWIRVSTSLSSGILSYDMLPQYVQPKTKNKFVKMILGDHDWSEYISVTGMIHHSKREFCRYILDYKTT